ncbi:hypothetical protein LPJ66_010162 [Kickxella alabastrina]|uniref:Uncharacterized protein n=1 Tax=Kickxella alabastrina TaxID=61397 RepID=A0ACC1I1T0_9FUNG|nr:hypothetical protein LPJ66_010162 [Kickxella alabastrina]
MTANSNISIKLVRNIPSGAPTIDDFQVETVDAPTKESLKDNQILVRNLYLSCDPFLRGRMTGSRNSYIASFEPGNPIEGFGVGIVEASANPDFSEGDIVTGNRVLWETRFVTNSLGFVKVPSGSGISAASYLGVLGMPSFTAYVGLISISNPKAGETVLVSAASGAVGQMVVQLAKARGLHVVGLAGSDDKVDFVKSIGADAVINYKTTIDLDAAIRQAAPNGIDIYFENVGGELFDIALKNMNTFGRIAGCGMISQYNATPETAYCIKNIMEIVIKRITISGFVVSDYYTKPDYKNFIQEVSTKLKEGVITYKLDEVVGLENAPQALLDLFEGKNFGKRVVKVSDISDKQQ